MQRTLPVWILMAAALACGDAPGPSPASTPGASMDAAAAATLPAGPAVSVDSAAVPSPAPSEDGVGVPATSTAANGTGAVAGSPRDGGVVPAGNVPVGDESGARVGAAEGAQDDGAAILQRASAAYARITSLRADFVMRLDNPLLRQQHDSRGTLYQQRPDRITLRFREPDGDLILGDGESFWFYYPSVNAQQVQRMPAVIGDEPGVDLQAQFVGDPVRRFRYTLHDKEPVNGRTAHVLTLVPRTAPAPYRSLKVWLDERDSIARRFEIEENNGMVRRIELSNVAVNPVIPEATFRFTPPPGVRILDVGR